MAEEKRIEIPYVLESVLRYCLKDAQERMEKGETVLPFSALAVKDTLFMEEHDADSVEESFDSVKKLVSNARGASAYGFCYDGYIEMPSLKKRDCLIAQGGVPGGEYGHAIGVLYTIDSEGKPVFEDEPIYVGNALNYMQELEDPDADDGQDSEEAPTE